jgi:hypothetical protein
VGFSAALLGARRAQAFVALAACVLAWFIVAPHVPRVGLWPAILIVSVLVMPGTLALVYLALPLWSRRTVVVVAAACALLALVFSLLDWGLPANFAKLWAAVFAGWGFLLLFEQLSWVVLVACVIPLVDAFSVWRGPTKAITSHHFEVYTAVAIAFLVPGGGAAYLGPPDVLFYALFLAAAARWQLRVLGTWLAMTFMYGFTVVLAYALDVGGLPALPFLSFGFLVANADLIWRSIRPQRDRTTPDSSAAASSAADDRAPS